MPDSRARLAWTFQIHVSDLIYANHIACREHLAGNVACGGANERRRLLYVDLKAKLCVP
jgi:hypothetical protein